jgi:uncharacterized protein
LNDSGRIVFVDALRGYALMGLFLIHMVEYFEIYWLHPEPGPVNTVMFAIFGGKAYAIFALLFGLSFYIILDGQSRRGRDFRARFAWRVTLLLTMGYLHGLLYGGDILQLLAITGFLILPLWRAPSSALLIIAFVCILQLPTLLYYAIVDSNLAAGYVQAFAWQIQPSVLHEYAYGTLTDVISTNAADGTLGKWAFMIESGRFSNILGMAVLGCLLGRVAFFTDGAARMERNALVLFAFMALAALMLEFREDVVSLVGRASAPWLGDSIVGTFTNNLFALATVLILLVAWQNAYARKALVLLAPPGRMTLTMYVMQSVLFVPFFYGFGLNAHSWIGQGRAFTLGIVAWAVLIMLAHFWMRAFRYGPLEWLWRALTLTDRSVPFARR